MKHMGEKPKKAVKRAAAEKLGVKREQHIDETLSVSDADMHLDIGRQ